MKTGMSCHDKLVFALSADTKHRYVRTVDICHDHFGFYLAWGSAAWLPTMYTLQAQYLARYPVHLSPTTAALILAVGLSGYVLFRLVNEQKDRVRKSDGNCNIWGAKAKIMRCRFKTSSGQEHQTVLLISGKHATWVFIICSSRTRWVPTS